MSVKNKNKLIKGGVFKMDVNNTQRYEQYIEKFFETNKVKERGVYKSLFNKLEDFDKFITEWNISDLEEFIKKSGSISVNTINKYLQYSKDIYKFICKENNVEPKRLYLPKDLKFYIDLEEFINVTLTEMQYKMTKNLIIVETHDWHTTSRGENIPPGEYNFRDKVLFMSPWEVGLTNQDLKYLKESDVELYREYGKDKIRLRLKDRIAIVTNEELIEAIMKTKEQNVYYRIESQINKKGREYFTYLKYTPMLIKPVAMRQSNKDEVANPSTLLNRTLRRIEAEHNVPGVILSKITIESIKRSKVVHMLQDDSYSIEDVAEWFGRDEHGTSDIYWISEVAQIFKQKEKELRSKNK